MMWVSFVVKTHWHYEFKQLPLPPSSTVIIFVSFMHWASWIVEQEHTTLCPVHDLSWSLGRDRRRWRGVCLGASHFLGPRRPVVGGKGAHGQT